VLPGGWPGLPGGRAVPARTALGPSHDQVQSTTVTVTLLTSSRCLSIPLRLSLSQLSRLLRLPGPGPAPVSSESSFQCGAALRANVLFLLRPTPPETTPLPSAQAHYCPYVRVMCIPPSRLYYHELATWKVVQTRINFTADISWKLSWFKRFNTRQSKDNTSKWVSTYFQFSQCKTKLAV
jgi:hypothetical protein